MGSKWVNGASLTQESGDVITHVPANPCIKAFTLCNDGNIFISESNEGKSVDGIYDETVPAMTILDCSIYALNPVIDENSYTGRAISQTAAGNDGNPLPEGVPLDIVMVYLNEFYEDTPSATSQYGLIQGVKEFDPLYPAGFEPSAYADDDGYLFPAYKFSTVTGSEGVITIDADKVKIPEGYYDVAYMTKSLDVVGMLRVIEIT